MKTNSVLTCSAILAMFGSLAPVSPLGATCHVHSPLILDLDGGGVETTSRSHPVSFDIDADGVSDTTAWTWEGSEEAFLWLDRDGNGLVNNGGELFGDATLLPNGEEAANGFDALAAHDAVDQGGNGDRLITRRDSIWSALRLWVDRNHNGISESSEVTTLDASGVIAIGLLYWEANEMDGHANTHRFKGYYLKGQRTPSGYRVVLRDVDDVYFLRRVGGS
jgi:hypothetical protein